MPKLNLIGVVVATVAFYLVGFLWYGVLFAEAWMEAAGVTQEAAESESPAWMALGVVLTLMQVVGLALVLKWKGATTPAAAAVAATTLWALIALPFTLYAYTYTPAHDATMLMIDASHLFVGWIVSAIILTLFK